MKTTAAALVGALAVASLSCQSTPSMPIAPTAPAVPSTPTAPSPAAGDVSGTWKGTGSDSFSPELVTWVLSQSGTNVTGTAEMDAVDPADGTCGSCHKVKKGTFTGTLSGSTLSVSMNFPAGGDVPSPICIADLSGTGTLADRRMTVSYTGTDTCEGFYSNGAIELTRQP